MLIIGEAVVWEDVVEAQFMCELRSCKGACCTMEGGRGAPLLDEEIPLMEKALPAAKKYISDSHRSYIEKYGFFEGEPADFTTRCIDNRACVFVYYDDDIAKCSLERAFNEGKTDWKKPISCHLFPLRVSRGAMPAIRYEEITECRAGVENGRKEKVRLISFLEEPLRRRFGDEWYENLLHHLNGAMSR
jgi:hypothetical protein